LIINWHGGGLTRGSALFPLFFPPWLLTLAEKHEAIIISPDYTLLPSPNGLADITADIEDFWKWLHKSCPSILSSRAPLHTIDLDHILVNGGSAGGYLAASLSLSHPHEIRALALAYPMLDFDSEWFKRGSAAVGAPNPFNAPDSAFPSVEALRAKVADLAAGPVASEDSIDRDGLMGGLARYGLLHEIFDPKGDLGGEIGVWPVRRVKAGEKLPARVWVMHGEVDSAVPVDGSRVFCAEVEKALGGHEVEVRLDLVPGKDHGFDFDPAVGGLIKEATTWLAEIWLKE
jgi:acetyl esterase/lipase